MYAHLATMSTDKTNFIVEPLNALPTSVIKDVKELIRNRILTRSSQDLVNDSKRS